jgi:hypothetical protein
LARLDLTRVEPLTGLHSNGRLLALPANVRIRWKLIAASNNIAYNNTATITVKKHFIIFITFA